jgi:hypothetical protein
MNTALLIAITLLGKFSHPHQIAFLSYDSKAACEADKGNWDGQYCIYDAEDTVAVTKTGSTYKVAISTVTNNAHSCDFQGTGSLKAKNVIVASAPTGEAGKACSVRLTYAADGTLTTAALSEDNCAYFCGMNARLDVSRAKRQ